MRPTQHSSNTRVLGAPAGWGQGELPCSALAITDSSMEGVPCVVSYWKPDAADLAAPRAIAQITPAPIACRHHGLKSTVETFAGRQWGVQQAPEEIVEAMSKDKP